MQSNGCTTFQNPCIVYFANWFTNKILQKQKESYAYYPLDALLITSASKWTKMSGWNKFLIKHTKFDLTTKPLRYNTRFLNNCHEYSCMYINNRYLFIVEKKWAKKINNHIVFCFSIYFIAIVINRHNFIKMKHQREEFINFLLNYSDFVIELSCCKNYITNPHRIML